MTRLLDGIDRASRGFGRAIAWLMLLVALIVSTVVVLRYVFNIGFPWLQEGYVYLSAAAFMLGAAYTLLVEGHCRVDIFYRDMTPRRRAWVDLLGHLFLLWPMVLHLLYVSWPYAADSWGRLEGTRVAGGLPGVFLIKSALPAFCVLLLLQSLSLALRRLCFLLNRTGEAAA